MIQIVAQFAAAMLIWTGHSKSSTSAFTACCMLHERSSETCTQFRVQKQQLDLLRGPKQSSRDHIDSEWIKMAFCIRTQRLLGCKHEQKGRLLALIVLIACFVSIFGARLPGELQLLCTTPLHRWGLAPRRHQG